VKEINNINEIIFFWETKQMDVSV